jgi:hypothetical protein
MFPIVIKIGDVEYDTGTMISNQPHGADWELILDMLTDFIQSDAHNYVDGEWQY